MVKPVTFEMGLTYAEFFRTLASAMANMNYRVDDHDVQIDYADGRVNIQLGEQQQRRIALLNMPYVPVRFEFEALQQSEADAFMEHFMRYFQRGGG